MKSSQLQSEIKQLQQVIEAREKENPLLSIVEELRSEGKTKDLKISRLMKSHSEVIFVEHC